jgi:hypothetical protein
MEEWEQQQQFTVIGLLRRASQVSKSNSHLEIWDSSTICIQHPFLFSIMFI